MSMSPKCGTFHLSYALNACHLYSELQKEKIPIPMVTLVLFCTVTEYKITSSELVSLKAVIINVHFKS